MITPIISILLPVYNAENYLSESIDSILNQTFTAFELILIDDGSTDNSLTIMKNCADERCIIICNKTNEGIASSLNKGLTVCKGEFIARMDADDIALPKRFEIQISYFRNNPSVQLVAGLMKTFGKKNETPSTQSNQSENASISLFFNCKIAHPTVMMRTNTLKQYNLRYSQAYLHNEDWALWLDFVKHKLTIHIIPQIVLKYRIEGQNISINNFNTHYERTLILYEKLLKIILPKVTNETTCLHYDFIYSKKPTISNEDLIKHCVKVKIGLIEFGFSKKEVKLQMRPLIKNYAYRLADTNPLKSLQYSAKNSFSLFCKIMKYSIIKQLNSIIFK